MSVVETSRQHQFIPDTGSRADLIRLSQKWLAENPHQKHAPFEPSQAMPVPSLAEKNARFNFVINTVCEFYCVGPCDIYGAQRTRDVVLPRHVAIWAIKNSCSWLSIAGIGRKFGKRDHTTCLHAIHKIDGMLGRGELILPAHIRAFGRQPASVNGGET